MALIIQILYGLIQEFATSVRVGFGPSTPVIAYPRTVGLLRFIQWGFDHGAGHPLLFLDDAKAPNCQKNNRFNDLGNYSEWPKVAGAVIKACESLSEK